MKKGNAIKCPKCKGSLVWNELVQIGYEIEHDGDGGWDFTGNRLYEENDNFGDSITVQCRECPYSAALWEFEADVKGGDYE